MDKEPDRREAEPESADVALEGMKKKGRRIRRRTRSIRRRRKSDGTEIELVEESDVVLRVCMIDLLNMNTAVGVRIKIRIRIGVRRTGGMKRRIDGMKATLKS